MKHFTIFETEGGDLNQNRGQNHFTQDVTQVMLQAVVMCRSAVPLNKAVAFLFLYQRTFNYSTIVHLGTHSKIIAAFKFLKCKWSVKHK